MSVIKLSIKQITEIKHACGGNMKNPYRTHFNTGKDCPSWEELVEIGYAIKENREDFGGITYYVTDKCREDLRYAL